MRPVDPATHASMTAREAEGWAVFEAAVEAVPRECRTDPSLPDGWSVKDLLWHVAHWWDEAADSFEGVDQGEESDTDATNAAVLEASRTMSLEEVEAGLARSRDRMLRAWARAATSDDPEASETFEGETFLHYEDHLEALRARADV
jgi:uncharacterized damage-inducible protein DinB